MLGVAGTRPVLAFAQPHTGARQLPAPKLRSTAERFNRRLPGGMVGNMRLFSQIPIWGALALSCSSGQAAPAQAPAGPAGERPAPSKEAKARPELASKPATTSEAAQKSATASCRAPAALPAHQIVSISLRRENYVPGSGTSTNALAMEVDLRCDPGRAQVTLDWGGKSCNAQFRVPAALLRQLQADLAKVTTCAVQEQANLNPPKVLVESAVQFGGVMPGRRSITIR